MLPIAENYLGIAEQYYRHYEQELLNWLSSISTTTYVFTILGVTLPPIIALVFYELEQARLRSEEPKGCRKLGLKITSNLENEFDKKFSVGRPPSTEETSEEWWRLKSLWIYPVKSCYGVELPRGTVISTGMEYDRQFTFAQLKSPFPVSANTPTSEKAAHKWEYITQRQYPNLAMVKTEMWSPDQSVSTYRPDAEDVQSGGVIIISFPYQESGWRGTLARWGASVKGTEPRMTFRVPFDPSPAQIEKAGYTYEKMTIWKDTINALNVEVEIPEEFRYFLGISNKLGLFRVDHSSLKQASSNAPLQEKLGSQPVTGFQDAYPMQIINLASIRDFESKMQKSKDAPRLSAAQFRANLIITGPEAYHEDTWRKIKIGFYEYEVFARSPRNQILDVEQNTRERESSEPEKTLRNYRGIKSLGMQLGPLSGNSAMKVGDEITVLEVVADD